MIMGVTEYILFVLVAKVEKGKHSTDSCNANGRIVNYNINPYNFPTIIVKFPTLFYFTVFARVFKHYNNSAYRRWNGNK